MVRETESAVWAPQFLRGDLLMENGRKIPEPKLQIREKRFGLQSGLAPPRKSLSVFGLLFCFAV